MLLFKIVWSPAGMMLLISLALFPAFAPSLRSAEGQLMPVVGDIELINVREFDGKTRFEMKFQKYRNCEFKGVAWYKRTPDGVVRLKIDPPEGDSTTHQSRIVGQHLTGTWTLYTPAETMNEALSVVYHQCHPFWITQTHFYP